MKAAVFSGDKQSPSEFKDSLNIPKIKPDELLIKAKAFAINPTDWKSVHNGSSSKGDILGCDVSGVVVEVGENVPHFEIGDFVGAFVVGNIFPHNGAFAEFVAANAFGCVKYDSLDDGQVGGGCGDGGGGVVKSGPITTFLGAASATLGLVTIGDSFSYQLKIGERCSEGDYILIWGGASATGILAIQLAKAIYGLNVITTASRKNHEYLKSIGADYVFDYHDEDVGSKIKEIGRGMIKFGLDTIAQPSTFQQVYDATSEASGDVYLDSLLFLDSSSIKLDEKRDNSRVHYGKSFAYLAITEAKKTATGVLLKRPEDMLKYYEPWWFDVLPKHIKSIKHANLRVLTDGLKSVDEGLKLSKEGVSNEKVVFGI
ncbi:hypothetical protein KGF57_005255 [Candida theae]|uniref:Enoyl reductase (ER) domain-containing protein n=1 Tax=Candida theae TaxID=1198502 RepID=A0AAD5B9J7_9ASCO|nr:uncharacterized protein KGF57_005255 [Candida theae]KAI5948857.1 hypothetical protein KGF57_005255 [Candida theae]